MNTEALQGYETRLRHVPIPNTDGLMICSLLDRCQYSDPKGVARQLGIGSAAWPLSGLLWPSAIYLAARLALRPVEPDEQVLEIGCGLALPSLTCHRRGVNVVASDHHPLVPSFLLENLRLNQLSPTLKYRHGHWGTPAPGSSRAIRNAVLSDRYDFIIGSDLLYESDTAPALAAFIDRHALPSAKVWMVNADRGYRPAFNRHMARLGFALFDDICLNRKPCLSGARSYKGHFLEYRRD